MQQHLEQWPEQPRSLLDTQCPVTGNKATHFKSHIIPRDLVHVHQTLQTWVCVMKEVPEEAKTRLGCNSLRQQISTYELTTFSIRKDQ